MRRPSAKFNLAYTAVGLTPDASTSFLLPRTIGAKRSMELMLLNRMLSAQEALEWGLVNQVVADEAVLSKSLEIGERLASGATRAFGRTKRLVAESLGALEPQMVLESETIVAQAGSGEGVEGIDGFPREAQAELSRVSHLHGMAADTRHRRRARRPGAYLHEVAQAARHRNRRLGFQKPSTACANRAPTLLRLMTSISSSRCPMRTRRAA